MLRGTSQTRLMTDERDPSMPGRRDNVGLAPSEHAVYSYTQPKGCDPVTLDLPRVVLASASSPQLAQQP
jgi:hypothetical protein